MDMTEEHSLTQASGPTQPNRWALWGIGAGVLGIVANLVTDPILSLTTAQKQQGSAVLGHVPRTRDTDCRCGRPLAGAVCASSSRQSFNDYV
jgi:hypothetical protein